MRLASSQPRLAAALAVGLLLIAAIGLVGYGQLRSTSRAYEKLVDRDARLTKDALELKVAINQEAAGVRGLVLTGGDDAYAQVLARARIDFDRELASARFKADSEFDMERLDQLERLHDRLQDVYRRELTLVYQGDTAAATQIARTEGREALTDLLDRVDEMISSEATELYRDRVEVGAVERTSEIAILGVLALALGMGVVVAVMALRAARRGAGAEAEAEAARAAASEEAALGRIARAIANEAEPTAVLRSAAEEAAGLLGAAAAAILRFEPEGSFAHVAGAAGSAAPLAGGRVETPPGGAVAACREHEATGTGRGDEPAGSAGTGPPVPARRAEDDPAARDGDALWRGTPRLAQVSGGQELAVPIRIGARAWGALWVCTGAGRTLPADAARRLERFADLASASISSADARAHLAQLAHEDGLTRLANHRSFHERLHTEVARAQRHGRSLSLVLLDLDHFKEINDSHGHQVGDEVLSETAARLQACARTGELVARIGGEEFAWLLPEADAMEAFQAAERARRHVSGTPVAGGLRVTASAGVCDLAQAGDAGALVRLADGALFWAKAHGRDITFRYSPDVVTELSAEEQLEHLRRTRTIVGIRALARAVDVKDASTARHSERVAELAMAIAEALGWDDRDLSLLHEAALVHDVGKIGVPDAVLFKPGRLDTDEYETVKSHAALSAQIVSDVLSPEQVCWVLGHHERWDGGGYPHGFSGEDVPPGARILALADAWDVMTSERPYSAARSTQDALAEVRAQAGRQFAPAAVVALERAIGAGGLPGAERSRAAADHVADAARELLR